MVRYEETKTRLGDLHMEKVSLQEELQSLDQEIEKIRVRKEALEKEKVVITEKIEAIRERLRSDYRVENIEDVEVTARWRRSRTRERSSGNSRPWARSTSGQKRNRSS